VFEGQELNGSFPAARAAGAKSGDALGLYTTPVILLLANQIILVPFSVSALVGNGARLTNA
jgi:hypothetical protein